MQYILLVLGLVVLMKSADYLIEGSSALAKRLGVSTLAIGLTIVAFGTSMPEFVVNIISARNGATDVAFGNIVGSNIYNLLFILGVAAIIKPQKIARSTVWTEIPFAFLATIALLVMAHDKILDGGSADLLTKTDGLTLLLFFGIFLYYMASMALRNREESIAEKHDTAKLPSNSISALMIIGGIIGLYLGGAATVDGATAIAKSLGLSDFIISVTIVAIGTSLPELVTSVKAAMKGDPDLAVGNVVGSNIFNIFGILGITALINPVPLPQGATFDLFFLTLITALLFVVMFLGKKNRISRLKGVLFVVIYLGYIASLIVRA